MRCAAKKADLVRRAQTMPGVGPVTALAIETFAPDLATFRRGCDFAAWLGLVPKQHSTDGKARLGKTSKMGQRDIRTLLVSGAMAVLQAVERFDTPNNGWLKRLLTRKPRMGRRDCAGQQDGAWPLGHHNETRGLPESGGGDGIAKTACHDVPVSWECEEVTEK